MKKLLNQLSLAEALEGLQNGSFSSYILTKACLDRAKELNAQYNIYLTFNEQALEQAKLADKQIAQKSDIFKRKPLIGIPYALKDNFLTKNIRTTASAKVLDDFVPPYESTVSQRLKQAGAIVLGKTNMDAWAHGSSTETSDYGPTKNPWDKSKLAGGSSGGSTAAVMADTCIFAIGSETAGSIRQPSSWCGTTGLKPTYGRCSRYGVVAMASSTDSPGPITKNVDDAAYILEIIAGKDPRDATTIPQTKWKYKTQSKKVSIGIIDDYFLADAQAGLNDTVLESQKIFAQNKNFQFSHLTLLDPKYAIAVYTILQRSEVSSNLGRYDGVRYGNDRGTFGAEARRRMMLGAYALSSGYYDAYYKTALKVRTKIIDDFNGAFAKADILLAPTTPSTALKVGATQGQSMFGELQDILAEASSIAGLPAVSIPCGFIDGMPVGLQLIGKMGDEQTVLDVARYYQTQTNWHEKRPSIG